MTDALWTKEEASAAIRAAPVENGNWQASGVSIDSRTVEQGDLYIALKGPNFDGHRFIADAFDKGARAAISSNQSNSIAQDLPLLHVEDTQIALRDLAVHARDRSNATRICITGSVGKTGTKDALVAALSGQGLTHGTTGNLNNEIGAPLTLARMPANSQYAVFELGMNHAGELNGLSELARPHVAVITLIGPAHLEHFNTVAEIALAKAEIFAGLMPGGTAILNRDDAQFPILYEAACARDDIAILTFGAHADADMQVVECHEDAAGSDVIVQFGDQQIIYRIGSPGRHWVFNSLAVLAATHAGQADIERAAASFASLKSSPGRGEVAHVAIGIDQDFLLIDDSYNANPVSMRAAFATLAVTSPPAGGRRIAVLGDMLELGPRAGMLHEGLACGLKQAGADLVYCVGEHMKLLFEALPTQMRGAHAQTAQALAKDFAQNFAAAICPGDVVLVKGSQGANMNIIVQALKTEAAARDASLSREG